jgi:hypothetical protein
MSTRLHPRSLGLVALLGLVVVLLFGSRGVAAVDCISTPSDPSCTTFTIDVSEINPNITALCDMMPSMPGCTLNTICSAAGPSFVTTSAYCARFVVLKTLCDDMEMGYCDAYRLMCRSGSVVAQCNSSMLPIPSTDSTATYVENLCNTLNATECNQCKDGSGSTSREIFILIPGQFLTFALQPLFLEDVIFLECTLIFALSLLTWLSARAGEPSAQ